MSRKVSSAGSFVAAATQSARRCRGGAASPAPAVLIAAAANLCPARACKPVATQPYVAGTAVPQDDGTEKIVLPAGGYRVAVLLADGAPVAVRIALPGLARSTTVRPVADAGAVATTGLCIIRGEGPPAGAYAPGCPTADIGDDRDEPTFLVTIADPRSVLVASFGGFGFPPDGTVAFGQYVVSATPLTSADSTQIDIPTLPAPAPAAAAPPRGPAPQRPPAERPPGEQPPAKGAPETAADMLPATGLPSPFVALAPALLLAAAAARRARSRTR